MIIYDYTYTYKYIICMCTYSYHVEIISTEAYHDHQSCRMPAKEGADRQYKMAPPDTKQWFKHGKWRIM